MHTMNPGNPDEPRQLCTLLVDKLLFGIDVEHVQEVIRQQEMTPVPLAPAAVCGLINLRGQIVTAIDLRCQLGLLPRNESMLPTNVVIRTAAGVVSLQVDEIGDVVDVLEAAFESVPDTLPPGASTLIRGVYKLQDQLLLVLDPLHAVRV